MPVISRTGEPNDAKTNRVIFPFVAVGGGAAAKQALLMLAIEPGLRGVLIASGGSDESALVRALGPLLSGSAGESDSGVVELPLNITEDRLLGGLDLERTIATGERQISAGLLASANGRMLYVNDVNLLDSGAAAHLAQALDTRHVGVEREGLSAIHDADFIFVGTYNSLEGEPSPLLRDRIGLIVDSPLDDTTNERAEIIHRALCFDRAPRALAAAFADETARVKRAIVEARTRLPRVRVSRDQIRQISQIAFRLGVEGNRADVFALKAARSSAALAGRESVTEEDLAAAIQLVLAPRATALPPMKEKTEDRDEMMPEYDSEEENRAEVENADRNTMPGAIEAMIIEALDARVPNDLLSSAQRSPRPSRDGKRSKASVSTRGRYVRSVRRDSRYGRVAIDATLRAAAPFQLSRSARDDYVAGVIGLEGSGANHPHHRVKIEPGDLRFKELKHRSGILFIFAVDASGSMALNRMAQAKGALTRLLQQAYRHRDKVALISFRGERADVLLAPTRSIELAKRLVDTLPAGGGTPLSAAIVKVIELARIARLRGTTQAMLVLFTDGRANISLGRERENRTALVREELTQLGALLGSEEISSVVVDTKSRFVSSGEGEALARMLGARYFYLPRSDAEAVYDAITTVTGRPRET